MGRVATEQFPFATWIRGVPAAWDVVKGKWLFREVKDTGYQDETLLSVTQASGILPRDESEIRVWNPGQDVSGYKLVRPGDFVISLRSFQGGIEWSGTRGIVSPAYVVLRRERELNDGFFRHLLKSEPVISSLQAVSTGIRQGKNIGYGEFAEVPLPVPPLAAQRGIADFLDRETAKIDALIDKKQRLLALLEEKRTALITQAATKGLDPDVEMKDSGVEWIGQMPAHWDVVPLSRFWDVVDCKHRTVPFVDEGIPVASIGEVTSIDVDLSEAKLTTRREYEHMIQGGRKPEVGDIIYSRNATVGAAAFVNSDEPFCLGQDVCLIRSKEQHQRFLLHVLRSPVVLEQLEELMVGSTFRRINVGQIKRFVVPIPPVDDQVKIAGRCDAVRAQHSQLSDRIRSALRLLQEYRTALISSAVTGQIDVRDSAA